MKVKCPKCAKLYRLADDQLKPEGVKIRCTACETVFLVRPRPDASGSESPAPPPAPEAGGDNTDLDTFFGSGSPPAGAADEGAAGAEDDLDALFGTPGEGADGGEPPGAPESPPEPETGAGEESIDAFFGSGSAGPDPTDDDLFGGSGGGEDDDLFADPPGGDDLFGEGDDDLFGAAPDDDLFGTSDDLFEGGQGAAPKAPAKPEPPAPAAGGGDDASALDDLFDDSDLGGGESAADTPGPAADPGGDDASGEDDDPDTVIGFGKSAIPDFDWDDEEDENDEDDDAAAGPGLSFAPGIRDHDAEQVLERTVVHDREATGGSRRTGLLLVLLLVMIGAGAFFAFTNPQARQVLSDATGGLVGASESAAKRPVATSPIKVTQGPETSVVHNRKGFAIFVVEGQLVNSDDVPHSFVRVNVALGSVTGTTVTDTTVYAGNHLSQLQLRNFPPDELKNLLQVEMGNGLKNFNIAPGEQLPFMAVYIPAPEDARELTPKVRIAGSYRGER